MIDPIYKTLDNIYNRIKADDFIVEDTYTGIIITHIPTKTIVMHISTAGYEASRDCEALRQYYTAKYHTLP